MFVWLCVFCHHLLRSSSIPCVAHLQWNPCASVESYTYIGWLRHCEIGQNVSFNSNKVVAYVSERARVSLSKMTRESWLLSLSSDQIIITFHSKQTHTHARPKANGRYIRRCCTYEYLRFCKCDRITPKRVREMSRDDEQLCQVNRWSDRTITHLLIVYVGAVAMTSTTRTAAKSDSTPSHTIKIDKSIVKLWIRNNNFSRCGSFKTSSIEFLFQQKLKLPFLAIRRLIWINFYSLRLDSTQTKNGINSNLADRTILQKQTNKKTWTFSHQRAACTSDANCKRMTWAIINEIIIRFLLVVKMNRHPMFFVEPALSQRRKSRFARCDAFDV